jgi:CBS domain-containing membrane protein
VIGMIGQDDFLHHVGLDDYQTLGERLRKLLGHILGVRGRQPATVADVMKKQVDSVRVGDPIAMLVPR